MCIEDLELVLEESISLSIITNNNNNNCDNYNMHYADRVNRYCEN